MCELGHARLGSQEVEIRVKYPVNSLSNLPNLLIEGESNIDHMPGMLLYVSQRNIRSDEQGVHVGDGRDQLETFEP